MVENKTEAVHDCWNMSNSVNIVVTTEMTAFKTKAVYEY